VKEEKIRPSFVRREGTEGMELREQENNLKCCNTLDAIVCEGCKKLMNGDAGSGASGIESMYESTFESGESASHRNQEQGQKSIGKCKHVPVREDYS
jgi:hypothetical protein